MGTYIVNTKSKYTSPRSHIKKIQWFFLMLALSCGINVMGQNSISQIEFNNHKFYFATNQSSEKLLIFLHGGVNNPAFSANLPTPTLHFLLEGNESFIDSAAVHGFDVLLPVKDDSLNWLTNYSYCHGVFADFINSKGHYAEVYISGFSDGGTGSYRIFYNNPGDYAGLVVFNGYPQHQNHNLDVNYAEVTDRKVLFITTFDDDVIPYDFLLTEYCKQKRTNPDTYLYITKGSHTFSDYKSPAIHQVFDMLTQTPDNSETKPLHGYIRGDTLVEFYHFRKKIYRKYGYGAETLEENRRQEKLLLK